MENEKEEVKKSKNKKIILFIGFLALVLVGGFLAFTYRENREVATENQQEQEEGEEQENTSLLPEFSEGVLESTTPEDQGGLTVCVDQCGDGICQNAVPSCEENNLNCICLENTSDCPQDCR